MTNLRCAFLVEDYPISPDAPGGAGALFHNHLELLAAYGAEIHLVILSNPHSTNGFPAFTEQQPAVWDTVRGWCSSATVLQPGYLSRKRAPLAYLLSARRSPDALLRVVDLLDAHTLQALRDILTSAPPYLIWAEHFVPAMLVGQIAPHVPFVYSHLDWLWRIKRHSIGRRANSLPYRLKFGLKRRAEEALVRRAAACVAASFSEAEAMRKLGARHVMYLPTLYAPVNLPVPAPSPGPPRIVHLGGMKTTANRLGLKRFLDVAWPVICEQIQAKPALWVIGSLEGADEPLLRALQQAEAVCTGFVQDLSTVLRPYDIHIVPWEYDTGTRTRIPLALNYAQALVSTRAAAACLPELTSLQDCVLSDDLYQMATAIINLMQNPETRIAVGNEGRAVFLRHFTREALQPRFNQFVDGCIGHLYA